MNRTKIDWADFTWNPATGCYGPGGTAEKPNRCSYCYARRMAYRLRGRAGYPANDPFAPTFHSDRLLEPNLIKRPSRIFVGSMGEMFAPYVPDHQVEEVLRTVRECHQHTFIFLTQNPEELSRWNPWPRNAWVGVTATDDESLKLAFNYLENVDAPIRFLSIEPLLGDMGYPLFGDDLEWVIVGAMTGPGAQQHKPRPEWIKDIERATKEAGIPLFEKNNLRQHFPDMVLRQEFPHA